MAERKKEFREAKQECLVAKRTQRKSRKGKEPNGEEYGENSVETADGTKSEATEENESVAIETEDKEATDEKEPEANGEDVEATGECLEAINKNPAASFHKDTEFTEKSLEAVGVDDLKATGEKDLEALEEDSAKSDSTLTTENASPPTADFTPRTYCGARVFLTCEPTLLGLKTFTVENVGCDDDWFYAYYKSSSDAEAKARLQYVRERKAREAAAERVCLESVATAVRNLTLNAEEHSAASKKSQQKPSKKSKKKKKK